MSASPIRAARGGTTALYAGLAGLFVCVLIWAPFGTTMLGLIEEWQLPQKFIENGITFFTFAGSQFSYLALRPFNFLPQALAFVLAPDSFLGWHALQIAAFAAKAAAMAAVVWWLTRRQLLAIFAGLLLTVYPADTMQISLRALHINWAVALSVGGVALILASTDMRRGLARAGVAVLGAAAFASGSLMYEAGLFLAPLPVLLWWAKYGFRRGLSSLVSQPLPILVWTAAVVAVATYMVVAGNDPRVYQSNVSTDPGKTLATIVSRLPALLSPGLYRTLFQSWLDAGRIALTLPVIPVLWAGAAMLFAFGLALRLTPESDGPTPAAKGLIPRLMIAGILAAAAGYLPYLASMPHIVISQRTYIFAAPGGVLVATAVVLLAMRWRPSAAVMLAFVLLCLGIAQQEKQMAHFVDLSLKQRMLLAGTVAALAGANDDQRILVTDQSGYLTSTWMLRGEIFQSAIGYLRGVPARLIICQVPSMTWSSFTFGENDAPGTCEEAADRWVIGGDTRTPVNLPKAGLIRLDIDADGNVRRLDGATGTTSPEEAKRFASLLGCWPAAACMFSPTATASWHYEFGEWWSLEQTQWGAGWVDEQWVPPSPGTDAISFAWINTETSHLWFRLEPVAGDYRLSLRLQIIASDAARDMMTAQINGVPVALTVNGDILSGTVPEGVLRPGRNGLTLKAPLDPRWSVSVAVDWVDVAPAGSA